MTQAIVDTHALIWFLENNPHLGRQAHAILVDAKSQLIIPVIVLCEFYYYLRKKKVGDSYNGIFNILKGDPRILLASFEADLIPKIPDSLELHDGMIAALHSTLPGSVILSKDGKLKKWGPSVLVWE